MMKQATPTHFFPEKQTNPSPLKPDSAQKMKLSQTLTDLLLAIHGNRTEDELQDNLHDKENAVHETSQRTSLCATSDQDAMNTQYQPSLISRHRKKSFRSGGRFFLESNYTAGGPVMSVWYASPKGGSRSQYNRLVGTILQEEVNNQHLEQMG
mmetsp:Transcript_37158/g.76171  ORF Transcript_37158/g.76171 Transcript_37158/m.76171 type:complete len:153 (+) Transcript_37158:145-603(+)